VPTVVTVVVVGSGYGRHRRDECIGGGATAPSRPGPLRVLIPLGSIEVAPPRCPDLTGQ
jgi:hypothetical protein